MNLGKKSLCQGAAALIVGSAFAAAPAVAAQTQHLRGTITSASENSVQLETRSGEQKTVELTDDTAISGAVDSSLDEVKKGTFIGTANVEGKNGNQALEVVVFPESMAGRGLGDYAWDLSPSGVRGKNGGQASGSSNELSGGSSMTNGTVQSSNGSDSGDSLNLDSSGSSMTNGTVKQTGSGGAMTVKVDYGKGTKTITIPKDAPVVKLQKADSSDLKEGAKVFTVADTSGEQPVAKLVIVGLNGTVPPM